MTERLRSRDRFSLRVDHPEAEVCQVECVTGQAETGFVERG